MALASGATFAGYLVARRLGSGATGAVYLVQDPRASCWQALKVLSPALSNDGEFRRRFLAEIPVATRLSHPNIVEARDRGEFESELYVAMEYVEGINAARLIADRFPAVSPAGEVLAIVTALSGALDYAHERGLLHRDVKPANVLLTGRGEGEQRTLLTDFGVVHHPGTAGYAAPEQLLGVGVDRRADQYALAATAFHLLTGAPPPLDAAPSLLSDQRPELALLDSVFARALAHNAADRFATCREFAEAANDQAGVPSRGRSPEAALVADHPAYAPRGAGEPSPAGSSAPRLDDSATPPATPKREPAVAATPRRRRSRRFVVAAAVLVLVAALLAVGFVIGRKTDTTVGPHGRPTTSPPPAPAPPASAPVALDGTYRIEVQRTAQTFNYTPDPQPPDVNTWWAFRSSCAPGSCTAAGTPFPEAPGRPGSPSGPPR
ncbi:serine/threonine-protein kinase [Mycobacterium sp.]|uniref:serine/threonine-protein kinase n=1 Tax=Mycobacterium sp. TaxID=1785 RepID=UPI002BA63713|nr:protein kinase [Mycobacterium sp.]HTY31847.1 protein kinase [Mycobacterium sp.]